MLLLLRSYKTCYTNSFCSQDSLLLERRIKCYYSLFIKKKKRQSLVAGCSKGSVHFPYCSTVRWEQSLSWKINVSPFVASVMQPLRHTMASGRLVGWWDAWEHREPPDHLLVPRAHTHTQPHEHTLLSVFFICLLTADLFECSFKSPPLL